MPKGSNSSESHQAERIKELLVKQNELLLEQKRQLEQQLFDARAQLREKSEEFSLFRQVGEIFNSTLDLHALFDLLLTVIIDETGAENCSLMLLTEDRQHLRIVAARGKQDTPENRPQLDQLPVMGVGEGIAGRVALEKRPILARDAGKEPLFEVIPGSPSIKTIMCLPLIQKGETIGVLNLSHPDIEAFTESNERVLAVISNQAAGAITNAKLHGELMQINLELEQRVQQAVNERELMQKKLFDSEKLALIGQLASGVAHEINNPLTTILLNIQLLGRQLGSPAPAAGAWQRPAERIEAAARLAKRIVQELLEYSRQHTAVETLAIVDVVKSSLGFVADLFPGHGVRIETAWPDPVPLVQVDPTRLQQVFVNLMTNAFHAMDYRGRLAIEVGRRDGAVEVAFRDSGPGIPPEVREHVFEPFFTTRSASGGTGLGLPISHAIVQRHGGDLILAESSAQGSVFIVRLPQVTAPAGEGPP